jgi:proteic killer suppression protein
MIDKYVKLTYKVGLEKVLKKIKKHPNYIQSNIFDWVRSIEKSGLVATQKLPGYRDKPLYGKRKGQRSIRLSRAYRLFYLVDQENSVVIVLEVNKHEY